MRQEHRTLLPSARGILDDDSSSCNQDEGDPDAERNSIHVLERDDAAIQPHQEPCHNLQRNCNLEQNSFEDKAERVQDFVPDCN